MASLFGHGLVGFTLTKIASSKTCKLLLFLAIVSAILPDLDVVTFGKIPYTHPFGHRGFTHSIVFAIIWAAILAFIFTKTKRKLFFVVLFLSTLSHGVLDALTTGGKGIGFFIPFNNERFFFPWQVIKVSPIGISKFFSSWGVQVILSELKYIGIPCLIVLLFLHFKRKTTKI
ncbi:metal-dependent hydrolase [Lacinutrix sp. Bg11-31]|uniref:metal-dependent hydrolase n=1 Tax=Lacinutrix sp. Bg11-31 TaxID=2057808 RepID=UPI000C306AA1|nr:metal-dependent hydrolase [Lacinutrix sp. Bg11-31]AUC83538.1 metal-dependent hydrolase [Lacinutrix sp. Bg11-31]